MTTTNELMKKLKPIKMVSTVHLCQLFGFNDGGKYFRRHLRKHFSVNHDWGQSWVWSNDDQMLIEIVAYFNETLKITDDKTRSRIQSCKPDYDVKTIVIK